VSKAGNKHPLVGFGADTGANILKAKALPRGDYNMFLPLKQGF
jgi:hypothetical protein